MKLIDIDNKMLEMDGEKIYSREYNLVKIRNTIKKKCIKNI